MAPKYFYLLARDYRLRGNEAALALAECRALAGGVQEEERIICSETCADVARGAFTVLAAEQIAQAHALDPLCEKIRAAAMDAPGFHVEVLKIPKSLPENSLAIQERVGDVLSGHPDLMNPMHRFVVVRTESGFRFGRITSEAKTNWGRPATLPRSLSRSIPARIARAMVNLVACPGEHILDPCCGAGTIPIQAMAAGIRADASDINPKMVEATNENLTACGYPPCANCADVLKREGRWDAVVSDLPYGWFGHETEQHEVEAILGHLLTLAPWVAVATASERHPSFAEANVRGLHTIPLPVSKKGTRYIHVVESSLSRYSDPAGSGGRISTSR